jgi:Uma2 family endonuclease
MSTIAHFSLQQYEHMVDVGAFSGPFQKRLELLRGEIVEMTPIGIEHANVVTALTDWSYEVVPRDKMLIRAQNPIRISLSDSEPEPDIVWVKKQKYSQHPSPEDILLIIEVADSSLGVDRGNKLSVYAEAGIADYWIVNLLDRQIEVYRKPSGKSYQAKSIHCGDETIHPLAIPDASLQASRLLES